VTDDLLKSLGELVMAARLLGLPAIVLGAVFLAALAALVRRRARNGGDTGAVTRGEVGVAALGAACLAVV